ncbi:heat shock protein HtpX [Myxococcaceae bacterium]|nr:heat shock protein HtpX [Myxococcaceae bacterium]
MLKRIFLFLVVNLLVMTTITVVLGLLGVQPYLQANGLDLTSLAIFCLVWGMAGSFISLAISRWSAKRMMGVQVIPPDTRDPGAAALVQTVHRLATAAGIPNPEVGIYQSDDINAFATGPTKKRSLVAVSTGLLGKMDRAEVEGVLGHEVSHIANGDMVTMTLLQGIVNAFVMFLARVLAFVVAQAFRRDDNEGISQGLYFVCVLVFQIVFMIFGTMVVMAFSRWREFRADAGSARISGRENMVRALQALARDQESLAGAKTSPAVAAMQISSKDGFMRLFMSHPPLAERIARLEHARL